MSESNIRIINEAQVAAIAAIFEETLAKRQSVDLVTHKKHHDFIELRLAVYKQRMERREAVIRQILGWGSVLGVTLIGTAVYNFFFKNGGT